MTKVVLVESHPLMRLGLHQMLGALSGNWDIVAMDTCAVKEFAYLECPIELVIFGFPSDIDQGWKALANTAQLLRPERILLLTDATSPWRPPTDESIANIYGCITKTAPIEVLEAAIKLGLAGGECFPNQGTSTAAHIPSLSQTVSGHANAVPGIASSHIRVTLASELNEAEARQESATMEAAPATTENTGAMDIAEGAQLLNVTPRQYEVLTLLAKGYPIKTVSRLLNISTATAKAHASTLYQRLRVNSKGEAVYAARQRGARFD